MEDENSFFSDNMSDDEEQIPPQFNLVLNLRRTYGPGASNKERRHAIMTTIDRDIRHSGWLQWNTKGTFVKNLAEKKIDFRNIETQLNEQLNAMLRTHQKSWYRDTVITCLVSHYN